MKRDDHQPADDLSWRQSAMILAMLTFCGIVLRTVAIGREPLWADEALTAILVGYPYLSFPFTPIDPTPPLYYWLQKALVPDGAGPVAWRMVSLVAGVATVPLTYWLGRETHSRRAGLVAAGMVAVSAPLVDYAQEARAYALCVAMIAGSAAALAALTGGRLAGEAMRPARRRMLAIFAGFTTLAAFSHFIAILWVFPALWMLRLATDRERHLIELRELLVTVLAMLPFLVIELRREYVFRSEQDNFTWLTQLSPTQILRILGNQWLPFGSQGGWLAVLLGAGLLIALLWFARRSLLDWGRSSPLRPLIVAILLFEPLGLWLLGVIATPVAMPRTMLPASIGFAVLAGIAIAALRPRASALVGTGLVGLGLASLLVTGTVRPKEQWAKAAAVTRNAPLVVTCPNWKTPSFMASASGIGWVVTSLGDHALVVRQPGDSASWDRLYFDRVQRVGHYPMRRERPVQLVPRPITAASLLFVASDCSKIERDAFARWAGMERSTILWSSPRTEDAADIRVEQWRLKGAAPLDTWIAR